MTQKANVLNLVSGSTLNERVSFISSVFLGMDTNNKCRQFLSMARQTLEADWLSSRGIREKFDANYRTFFTDVLFSETESDNRLDKLFSEQSVYDLCEALVDDMMFTKESDLSLFNAVMEDAIESDSQNPLLLFLFNYVVVEEETTEEETTEEETTEAVQEEIVFETETAVPTEIPTVPTVQVVKAKRPKIQVAELNETEYKEEKVNASMSFEIPLAAMISGSIQDYIENKSGILQHVTQRIQEEAQKLKPTIFKINDVERGKVEGKTHHDLLKAVKLTVREKQMYMAGVAGTGKTTLASQIAKALMLPFKHISCTEGMSEAHLLGRMVFDGSYVSSSFVECYENGGVFLFDEVDAADGNTMLVINSALANGHMSVPNRTANPIATRHKDFYCVCAANTWGWGSNEYAGRNVLDAAFLDRFVGSKLLLEYDKKLEKDIANNDTNILSTIWAVRANCIKYKIRRVVSTRAIVSCVRAVNDGDTVKEFMDTFFVGWSAEEITKAIEGVNY